MYETIAVSVIIPIYNVEAYLKECLDSAVRQTLKNIEILCIDDGSTDGSMAIAREYAEAYDNVILLHKENGGLSSARNFGMDCATGEYLYFMDSDDYLDTDALESLYRKAVEEDLDIVYFNAAPFFESKEEQKNNADYISYYNRTGDYSGVCSGQEMFCKMLSNGEVRDSACLQFFRRSMIEANQLRFFHGIVHEDNLFSLECSVVARRTGYLDRLYYRRRVRGSSIMTTGKSMKNVEGYLITISEMLAFLKEHPVDHETEEHLFRYLHYTIAAEASRIIQLSGAAEETKALPHGDPVSNFLLYMLKQDLKQNQSIREKYESSFTFRAGKAVTFLPRLIWQGIKKMRNGAQPC